jgi:hypothetical protein
VDQHLVLSPTRGKLDDRWQEGVWLGKSLVDGAHLVSTETGVVRARSIRRQEEAKRWNLANVAKLVGLPWDVKGKLQDARPTPKARYITAAKIRQYGASRNCTGCAGKSGDVHSAACRARFHKLFAKEEETMRAAAPAAAAAAPAVGSRYS